MAIASTNGLFSPLPDGSQVAPPSVDRYNPASVPANAVRSFANRGDTAMTETVPPLRGPISSQLAASDADGRSIVSMYHPDTILSRGSLEQPHPNFNQPAAPNHPPP